MSIYLGIEKRARFGLDTGPSTFTCVDGTIRSSYLWPYSNRVFDSPGEINVNEGGNFGHMD